MIEEVFGVLIFVEVFGVWIVKEVFGVLIFSEVSDGIDALLKGDFIHRATPVAPAVRPSRVPESDTPPTDP